MLPCRNIVVTSRHQSPFETAAPWSAQSEKSLPAGEVDAAALGDGDHVDDDVERDQRHRRRCRDARACARRTFWSVRAGVCLTAPMFA